MQAHQPYLSWGGDFPEEAQHFSRVGLAVDSPQGNGVVKTGVFVTLKDYLAADFDLVDRAAPATASAKLHIILPDQLRSLRYRAEKDPARGMFKRFCGEEWTKRVYSQLFVRLGTEAATIGK